MSATTIFMGRPTADPVIQQGKNNGTEYASLDIAVTQRGQNNENETIYYQCYFSSFLAQRLINAGVKKGTCLLINGTVDIHPFVYSKGQKAGQAGVSVNVRVLDWQFAIANKPEGQDNPIPGNGGMAPNAAGIPNNGGAATPGGGGYPVQGMQGAVQQNAAAMSNNGVQQNMAGIQANAGAQGGGQAAAMYAGAAGATQQMAGIPGGMMQGSFIGNGFVGVPENAQLPFGG